MYRSGLALAIGSYLLWGLFPLYWPLLEPAAPVEILAHRIVWSFVLLFALLAIAGGARRLLRLDRETVRLLAAAAALMAVNWGVFIYAVNSDRVVETSLGYFINPLVSVALAVGVLRERLRSLQRLAVAVAGAGVLVLTVGYGEVPWIGLVLACSFGTYGLLKKRVEIDAIGGLAVESAFLVVPAVAFLLWLGADGSGTFTSEDTGHVLAACGLGRRHRAAADPLRRGRQPDRAGHARPAPVHKPLHAVPDRRGDLRRGDAGRAPGGLRAHLGRDRDPLGRRRALDARDDARRKRRRRPAGPLGAVTPGDARQWAALERDIVACRRCPRLVAWREEVARVKRAAFAEEEYWGRPVPGFGDPSARVLILGLAPAAHGANRTARVFTGDRSGDWLFAALHRAGYASQPGSVSLDDGLQLRDCYIAAAVRCAPPANKPTPEERDNCLPYALRELELLRELRVVVALGAFGWDAALRLRAARGESPARPRPRFGHGAEHVGKSFTLLGCFHVSQQNTFTGKLTEPMLDAVLARARELAES